LAIDPILLEKLQNFITGVNLKGISQNEKVGSIVRQLQNSLSFALSTTGRDFDIVDLRTLTREQIVRLLVDPSKVLALGKERLLRLRKVGTIQVEDFPVFSRVAASIGRGIVPAGSIRDTGSQFVVEFGHITGIDLNEYEFAMDRYIRNKQPLLTGGLVDLDVDISQVLFSNVLIPGAEDLVKEFFTTEKIFVPVLKFMSTAHIIRQDDINKVGLDLNKLAIGWSPIMSGSSRIGTKYVLAIFDKKVRLGTVDESLVLEYPIEWQLKPANNYLEQTDRKRLLTLKFNESRLIDNRYTPQPLGKVRVETDPPGPVESTVFGLGRQLIGSPDAAVKFVVTYQSGIDTKQVTIIPDNDMSIAVSFSSTLHTLYGLGLKRAFDIWTQGGLPTLDNVVMNFYYMDPDNLSQLRNTLIEAVGQGAIWRIQFSRVTLKALMKSFNITFGNTIGWTGLSTEKSVSHPLDVTVSASFSIIDWKGT
jgi:hypothetical protein